MYNWRHCLVYPATGDDPAQVNSRFIFDPATCEGVQTATRDEVLVWGADDTLSLVPDGKAVDAGDTALLTNLTAGTSTDAAGGQRVYNRKVDIGALEYDWRGVYAATLGKPSRLTVTEAAPDVTTNGTAVAIYDGTLAVDCRTNGRAVTMNIAVPGSGTLKLYDGETLLQTFAAGTSETYTIAKSTDTVRKQLRFVYEKADGDAQGAEISSLALAPTGICVNFR